MLRKTANQSRAAPGGTIIEKTLFQFIWKHSKREQFVLLVVTSALFPFLFLTLELPKRIINDAIGAQGQATIFDVPVSQVTFLALLCCAFLLSVLAHGLLKMRINTMKGILSERMLRRLRYVLIEQMLRFPKPYFQRTSEGEMVTMITAETEPMGGLMGDALAQPVLQAGQMLTILFFLFLQSPWFGLAAIALIPLQAWLIPRLQRQINLLNKERIREVRHLSGIIGETASGASDLRLHGGWRYRLALVTQRLGVLYQLRFRIYQKKFFMKFINNFITQLTPFFFFSIGGYLVIDGAVSLGALVAALAAYKDLSSPWKELLTYYNQVQDMSLRWTIVAEKFAPEQGLDAALMSRPAVLERLDHDIELEKVTVADADGLPVLQDISARIAQGTTVAITAPSETDRSALADVLTREVTLSSGSVKIGGEKLRDLPQALIAARIGHVSARPSMFEGAFRDNVLMSLMQQPLAETSHTDSTAEALRAGNSGDGLEAPWLDIASARFQDETELRNWWLKLLEATGSSDAFFRRALDRPLGADQDSEFTRDLIAVRPLVWRAICDADLDRYVHRFDEASYNPALTVDENLVFATARPNLMNIDMSDQLDLLRLVSDVGLEPVLAGLSRDIVGFLTGIFGTDGTAHPLFRKLGLDARTFERAQAVLAAQKERPLSALSPEDKAHLISISAQVTAEQVGAAFPDEIREKVLELRKQHAARLQAAVSEFYAPLDPAALSPGLSVLENAIFGKLSDAGGARQETLRRLVSTVLSRAGLRPPVMELIFDMELSLSGANMPTVFAESLALARAAIKRPDILVLDMPLASYDAATRGALPLALRKLLPRTTTIFILDRIEDSLAFDQHLEIRQGRLRDDLDAAASDDGAVTAELVQKLRALERSDLFAGLDSQQLRLLAFGAKYFEAAAGEIVFNKGDDPHDGAYMIIDGEADLIDPDAAETDQLVATVGPGTLVGELGLIRDEPRALSLWARSDLLTLRLGAEEFLSVVGNDAATAFKLLQVVAAYRR